MKSACTNRKISCEANINCWHQRTIALLSQTTNKWSYCTHHVHEIKLPPESYQTRIRSMECESAQCMLFPTPVSKLAQFKDTQGQSWWCHRWFPVQFLLTSSSYLSPVLKYLTCNFSNPWCQSIAHGRFPIWLLLTPILYPSPFLKYLTCNFDDLELTFQSHLRSKVMVPVRSPSVVFYMTSIVSNIVSITAFEIFDVQVLWSRSRTV